MKIHDLSKQVSGENIYTYAPYAQNTSSIGTCGQVDRALDLRSECLGFDSHCWSCVEVSGKLLIQYCLCQPSSNWYQVERTIGKL